MPSLLRSPLVQTPLLYGWGRKAAAAYIANAVNFDGTNDYLTRGAGLTGAADRKDFTFSLWVKIGGADGAALRILNSTTLAAGTVSRLLFLREDSAPANSFRIVGINAAGTTILDVASTAGSLQAADGWVHVLGSFDLADAGKRHLYLNDVSDLATITTYTNATLDLTVGDWAIGARPDGAVKLNGDLADIWMTGGYIDFSVVANRRKFISAGLKPVDLGATGQLPTGTTPLIFLSNPLATWHTNLGIGEGFTEVGALTAAATSPSD